MSDEKMKILKMIEEKLISVEEGLKLLEAIKNEKASENVIILDKNEPARTRTTLIKEPSVAEDSNQQYNLTCKGKDEIRVELTSSDIMILTERRDDLYLTVDGCDIDDEIGEFLDITESEYGILIREKRFKDTSKNSFFGLFSTHGGCEINLHIPYSFNGELSVKTVSGDVDVRNVELDAFEFSSVSGDLDGNEIRTKASVFKTTSGDLEIAEFIGDLLFSTVSGDIDVDIVKMVV